MWLEAANSTDELLLLPCNHPACLICEREHPGVCRACRPVARWSEEQAKAWLVKHYIQGSEVDWAMRCHGDRAEEELTRLVANSWRGYAGHHTASYGTWNRKVVVRDPQGDPGFTFTVAAIVRAKLAAVPRDRISVAPGVYQGVLL